MAPAASTHCEGITHFSCNTRGGTMHRGNGQGVASPRAHPVVPPSCPFRDSSFQRGLDFCRSEKTSEEHWNTHTHTHTREMSGELWESPGQHRDVEGSCEQALKLSHKDESPTHRSKAPWTPSAPGSLLSFIQSNVGGPNRHDRHIQDTFGQNHKPRRGLSCAGDLETMANTCSS